MARYLIQVPRDVVSEERKAAIARAIVAAHHDFTGENPDSVQVAITEIDSGCFFAGGRLIECDHIFVHGFVPDNGDFDYRKQHLVERIAADVTTAADFERDSTWVTISPL
jgi:phenylpyruvate tautomerase PptA (4-oxalocrotonate tautomerase family)